MKAVIYARYSSSGQRDESIEGQIRECTEYAKKHGFIIVDHYVDKALSGKTDQRPSFQKMMRDSEHHKFQAVIMYTLDRFARNRYDSAMYKARLKKNGVQILYATQPISSDPEGIILESVLEGFAEYYSANLSRNVKRGMMENALKGIAPSSASRPLGYRIDSERKYEIDPHEAVIVKTIFEMFANGKTRKEIIDHCNGKGWKTARGRSFNHNSLPTILDNDRYTGVYRHMGVEIEGGMPKIISKALFDEVQEKKKKSYRGRTNVVAPDGYILTTKLFCGHCGASMIGESGRSETGKMYFYYKCSKRKNGCGCDKKPEKKEAIESAVIKYTLEQVLTDECIHAVAKKVVEILEKEDADKSELKFLKQSLKEVDTNISNLLNAIEQGIITRATKTRLFNLEEEKASLESLIAKEELQRPLLTAEVVAFWLNTFKNHGVDNIDTRRKIIDSLVNSIFVYDDPRKAIITYNISGADKITIKSSDIDGCSLLQQVHPNFFFILKNTFGFVLFLGD